MILIFQWSFSGICMEKLKKKDFLNYLFGDKEKKQNDKIFRVQSTYPGIELVHFYTNNKGCFCKSLLLMAELLLHMTDFFHLHLAHPGIFLL